jgi:hypothetical protein
MSPDSARGKQELDSRFRENDGVEGGVIGKA